MFYCVLLNEMEFYWVSLGWAVRTFGGGQSGFDDDLDVGEGAADERAAVDLVVDDVRPKDHVRLGRVEKVQRDLFHFHTARHSNQWFQSFHLLTIDRVFLV